LTAAADSNGLIVTKELLTGSQAKIV
jgi:hypothetical protein